MILILERDQFLKLFKFGEIKIPVSRFIDGFDVDNGRSEISVDLLDSKMPLFEQDHEVLILEIPKEALLVSTDVSVKLSNVRKIYPLTEEANRYLIGRMHPQIVIQKPVFEQLVQEIKIKRDFNLRLKAWDSLARLFKIEKSFTLDYSKEIEEGIRSRLVQNGKNKHKPYLHNLICFNRNPIYPQGNVEFLLKAGSVFVQMKGGNELDYERGPFYKYIISNSSKLSRMSLQESISNTESSSEFKPLSDELSRQYPKLDAFMVGVWYLYFIEILNKNSYDLSKIKSNIDLLKGQNQNETAVILQMVGVLFSFDNLYSSFYELNSIPIFNHNVDPGISEQVKILKKNLQQEKEKNDELKFVLDQKEKIIEDINSYNKIKGPKQPLIDQLKSDVVILKNEVDFSPIVKDIEEKPVEIISDPAQFKKELRDIEIVSVSPKLPVEIISDPTPSTKELPAIEIESPVPFVKSSHNDDLENYLVKEIEPDVYLKHQAKVENEENILGNAGGSQDIEAMFEVKEKSVKKEKSKEIGKSTYKSGLEKNKVSGMGVNDKNLHSSTITIKGLSGKHYSQSVSSHQSESVFYSEMDLIEIVRVVAEKKVLGSQTEETTFEEAMLNYCPKGGFDHNLIGEIEIIQTDLGLSQEIVDQLKRIILEVKK